MTFKSVKLSCARANLGCAREIGGASGGCGAADEAGDAGGVFLVGQMAERGEPDGPARGDQTGDEVGIIGGDGEIVLANDEGDAQ